MKSYKKIVACAIVGMAMLLCAKIPVQASTILGSDVTSYLASRSNTVSVGVYDANTGKTYTYNPSKTYYTMSIVKMSLLADVLYQKIPITSNENSLLTKMIENSDNSAASTIWRQLGSDKSVQSFFQKVGMTNTVAGTGGWWGRTTTTVQDQLTMMKYFAYPNTLLTDSQRAYGLNLMRNVRADQRWGTGAGLPSGVSVALKNGWADSGSYVNSVGYVNGQGKNYVISVLTTNNKSLSYGIETINKISSLVWNEIPPRGWVFTNGTWYFYTTSGKYTGWLHDNGKWYYLDSTGAMKTGWVKSDGSWYYLNRDGSMKTGWLNTGGVWYYLDNSGAMKTGWIQTNGKRYYLQSDGKMATGWLLSDNNWYYLQSSGEMRTGWILLKEKWYYLDLTGAMKTGWLELSGKKYFLSDSGAMVIGWQQIDGKWYYFNQNGDMAADTVIKGYKLGSDGAWIQVNYVALGDSLAAGMTPEGQDRLPVNGVDLDWGYPNYIAANFAKSYQLLDFANFGVSGYTTDNILADLERGDVQQEIQKATHLTLDIGANDLLPVVQKDPAQAPAAIAAIAGKISTILSTIDQLNPNVKVYVMGYYNPFPYMADPVQKEQLNQLLKAFNAQIQAQATQHGDTFVPTAQVINVSNFAEYITNPHNIHLSLLGYQVVAGEFWKVMQ
ncbi:GDSL-type esterase/lipase family protein [Neobacillus drentensis]|uniref:GDSL-type esterase/lipase family protein n=1 Tax=Neobacillus drentensis TaxID=220684 RepID=UPI003002574A